jgi:ABC-2 type transport system ATP-binding protein
MIKVEKIRKTFKNDFWSKPQVVLDDVCLNINEGDLIGFLGVNGAGKTTLLKIIMKYISHDHGNIIFSESMGKNRREILSNIGFLPERPYFYPYLQGREFLNLISELNNIPKNISQERISIWANRLKIDHALNKQLKDYSKGMLQRIGFVSVLLCNPKLVILDEPLAGLDPIGRKEFKDILREINDEGVTVFFSSHIVNDVEEVCSKVIVLEAGQIIYEGLISALVKEHQSKLYRAQLQINTGESLPEDYQILSKDGDLTLIEFQSEYRDKLIALTSNSNINLISLYPKHVSLEDIIYKIDK